ncbi:LysR family transcriptional regulator [Caproiciproducens galactitolivorans]|uniref:LysR family transcriptional regulator n=1 Tax=Caproiciproducens galactitolivorans TaxID=642589 RepID=A0ABT4BV75_9FIRM|nr:LysR family transcriptional regulator [Caproiciproducens galactitolivorans]MCY1714792.1 LysR family transcriptional regulator [Caproiciproducens galactitolivorans]
MTMTWLTYYVEVVKQRNFTRAAEKLFVSQSTLSKAIRALENEFQAEFIRRRTKDLLITQDGLVFYEYATKLLDYYHTQTQKLEQKLRCAGGTLALGLPPSAGTIYFSSLIYQFRKAYPETNLQITEITSKSIRDLVDDGTLDLGVVIEPFSDSRFYSKTVFHSEAVLVVPKQHPLASESSVDFEALKTERLLMVSPDYMYYDVMMERCKAAGFTPNIVFESSQWDLLLEMIANNQGVSILPKPLVDKLYAGRVCQLHLKNPEFPWALSVIYRTDKFLTVPMQHFLKICGTPKQSP